MKKRFAKSTLALLGIGTLYAGLDYLTKKSEEKDEFQKTCIYMAALDDEIARKNLSKEEKENCLPRKETLYKRYKVYSELYKDSKKDDLLKEVSALEDKLSGNEITVKIPVVIKEKEPPME